jgi:hypothetical protein
MRLKEIVMNPDLPKELIKATAYAFGAGALIVGSLGIIRVNAEVSEQSELDTKTRILEKELQGKLAAQPKDIARQREETMDACYKAIGVCRQNANDDRVSAKSNVDRVYQETYAYPKAKTACLQERLDCLSGLK